MNRFLGCWPMLLCFCMIGCQTTHYSNTEIRRMAAHVEIINEKLPSQDYKLLGEIKGIDCSATYYTKATSEGAMQKLKAEAAALGGNAIIDIACESTGMSWKYNCNNSVTCFGDAIIKH